MASSNLCPQCQNIRPKKPYDPIAELAAKKDCIFCTLLYQSIVQYSKHSNISGSLEEMDATITLSPLAIHLADYNNLVRRSMYIYGTKGQLSPDPRFERSYPIISDSSPEGINWFKDKNQACHNRHAECHSLEEATLPRRIVDVGHASLDVVRLCENIQEPGCNLPDRLVSFKVDGLPKTFRDAIYFTRQLGIRYLWIDSLCIIQDNVTDWDIESAKMAHYYGNVYLTVAALASPGDDHGFLGARNLPQAHTFHFTYNDTTYPITVEGRADRSDHESEACNPPLTRGWCFQEIVVSARLALFGAVQLYWRCRCETSSELDPTGERWDYYMGSIPRFLALGNKVGYGLPAWHAIVVQFSWMKLSRQSDRLPALSALASQFLANNSSLGPYVGGVWGGHLLEDVCWRSTERDDMPANARAPSWSWASVRGGVIYTTPFSTVHADLRCTKLEHVAWDLAGRNPFGAVKDASIMLRCVMIPALVTYDETEVARGRGRFRDGFWLRVETEDTDYPKTHHGSNQSTPTTYATAFSPIRR